MKLKYYLRGLAVGVIVTTIILTIANSDQKPMTDAEVRQRALELGMIESDSLKLSDVASSESLMPSESVETAVESSQTVEPVSGVTDTSGSVETTESAIDTSESVEMTESATDTSESVEMTESATDTSESATSVDGSADASVPPASEVTSSSDPIIITISSGDSSYTVSKALAAAGLVEDAVEYDNYLCNNGYSRKIRTGTYEILPGMTYEEIAKTISR